jgi:starch-binding outer membrane protein, SusD/RagB family
MFRLADVYLMRAEASYRLGDNGSAAADINTVRNRGYGNSDPSHLCTAVTEDILLAERMRELYWEGTRRTDLIRFDKYTSGTYLWPFKGGVQAGTGVGDHIKLYPIPGSDLAANPNLTQNPGY